MDMNVVSDILDDAELTREPEEFRRKLAAAINEHGWDNRCNVPDYILAKMLHRTLLAISMMDRETRKHNEPEPEITEPTLEDRVKDYASSPQEIDAGEGWELCDSLEAEQWRDANTDWITRYDEDTFEGYGGWFRRRKVMPGNELPKGRLWLKYPNGRVVPGESHFDGVKPELCGGPIAWCHRLDGETEPPKILVDWEGER